MQHSLWSCELGKSELATSANMKSIIPHKQQIYINDKTYTDFAVSINNFSMHLENL